MAWEDVYLTICKVWTSTSHAARCPHPILRLASALAVLGQKNGGLFGDAEDGSRLSEREVLPDGYGDRVAIRDRDAGAVRQPWFEDSRHLAKYGHATVAEVVGRLASCWRVA